MIAPRHLLLLLILPAWACAPAVPYYRTAYLTREAISESDRPHLVARIDEALKDDRIQRLEVDLGGGRATVHPKSADPNAPVLDFLPLPVLTGIDSALWVKSRGGEWDIKVPVSGAPAVPVSIIWELDGRMLVQQASGADRAPPAPPPPPPALSALLEHYPIGGVTDGDRGWTPEQLRVLDLALARLEPAELAHLRGLSFHRRAAADCDSKDAIGCYHSLGRVIELYDGAFDSDPYLFVGDVTAPLPASVAVALHEIGHAIDDSAHIALSVRADRAVKRLDELYDRIDALIAQDRAQVARINALIREESALIHEHNALIGRMERERDAAPAQRTAQERQYQSLKEKFEALRKAIAEQKDALQTLRDQRAPLDTQQKQEGDALTALRKRQHQASERSLVLREYDRMRTPEIGPTTVGRENLSQSFAESFALYHADPEALRRLMPQVYAWFAAGGHIKAITQEIGPEIGQALSGAPGPALQR